MSGQLIDFHSDLAVHQTIESTAFLNNMLTCGDLPFEEKNDMAVECLNDGN